VESNSRILFVGRLNDQKHVSLLIRALQGTGYGLDIVGDGDLREKLEQEAQQKSVDVHFLGRAPNHLLPEIYNAYPIYVLCSKYEGNPKTLLEAMASGCAVIGTNVQGIRGVIRHEDSGLITDDNPDALRGAIQRLFSDGALRKKLGENARQQILEQNSLQAAVQQELYVYQKLIHLSS